MGIAHGEAEQTDGVLVEGDFLQQLLGERKDLLFGRQNLRGGDGTGDLCEVVKLYFQGEGRALKLRAFQPFQQFLKDVIK